MIVVDIFSLSSLATRIKWLLQWIYVVKFATCDMNVVYGRQLKLSLELKRRLTTSTAVHLLVSLTAIIKFGLEPMDPIFKNGRCLDVYKKTLRTRFSWVLFIRETVPNTAIARVTMNDYLSPQLIFNLMMEHEGKQIVFTANTIFKQRFTSKWFDPSNCHSLVRKFLVCVFMDSSTGILTMFAFHSKTTFKYGRQVEMHFSRLARDRRFIVLVLNRNLWNVPSMCHIQWILLYFAHTHYVSSFQVLAHVDSIEFSSPWFCVYLDTPILSTLVYAFTTQAKSYV